MGIRVFLFLLAFVGAASSASAATESAAVREEIRFEQRLGAQLPDVGLTDESGKAVRFLSLFHQKPALLVFTYFRCPNLCGLALGGLTEALRKAPLALGRDYQVLAISIDPRDSIARAQAKKNTTLARFGIASSSVSGKSPWRYLIASSAEISRLTGAAGFFFKHDQRHNEYLHPSGVIVLTPEGRVSRYFLGIRYAPEELGRALIAARGRRVGKLVQRVLLYCLHYDPTTGRRGKQVLLVIRIACAATAMGLIAMIARLRRKEAARS